MVKCWVSKWEAPGISKSWLQELLGGRQRQTRITGVSGDLQQPAGGLNSGRTALFHSQVPASRQAVGLYDGSSPAGHNCPVPAFEPSIGQGHEATPFFFLIK